MRAAWFLRRRSEANCRQRKRTGWLRWPGFRRIRIPFASPDRWTPRRCRWPISGKCRAAASQGKLPATEFCLARAPWLQENRVAARDTICPGMAQSGSTVSVAIDGIHRGAFALENSLRPEVEQLIAELGGRFELALLSGDNEREAARFRKNFRRTRDRLLFNQSPADKLNFIRELQQRGRKVMMVGDGLNDAGALKQADVGVAVVEQVGVFSPASDVILDAARIAAAGARFLQFSRQRGAGGARGLCHFRALQCARHQHRRGRTPCRRWSARFSCR